jgi:four helix bundle protein
MPSDSPRLHHEDLDVYQAAIEFLALAASVVDQYPKGYSSMTDQLKRASLSIPLNIAEGYGKRGPNDRARFYDIARGSAHECGAILDASKVLSLISDDVFVRGKELLHRIVSMLVKMAG